MGMRKLEPKLSRSQVNRDEVSPKLDILSFSLSFRTSKWLLRIPCPIILLKIVP
jgi:hypothetical protein